MKRNYSIFSLYLLFLIESLMFGGFAASSVSISRDDFPPEFIFGAGTSAYQVEGAAKEDGRKPSIWDTFTHSGAIFDNSTGDIAADQYHKYKEDVKLMHDMGLDAYRFSISWSRLIPDGRGSVNPKGLQYYNNLIDELISYGIEPHVTIYHFDLPQALQDEYEGLLSPRIVEDYTAYADVCFKNFGDRVKYWVTFNEPNVDPVFGYDVGVFAPGHCSYGVNCLKGDSTRDPYTSAHNILLSHASAVALYREKYQAEQGGQIGLTIMALWLESFTNLPEDIVATQRARDFHIGWFIDPLVNGDYPKIMRDTVGSRLPSFHTEESEKLRASFDFIGITHYSVLFLQSYPNNVDRSKRDYLKDISVTIPGFLGTQATVKMFAKLKQPGLPPLPTLPWGLQRVLNYIKVTYRNPPIMIHENGYGEFDLGFTASNGTDDASRVEYLQGYLESLLESIRNGSNVRGYFVWSLMDCFELPAGYTSRFGLYGVDFSRPDRRRYPRRSAKWYSDFLTVLRNQASSVVIHGE